MKLRICYLNYCGVFIHSFPWQQSQIIGDNRNPKSIASMDFDRCAKKSLYEITYLARLKLNLIILDFSKISMIWVGGTMSKKKDLLVTGDR